jgi:hypothetical protein
VSRRAAVFFFAIAVACAAQPADSAGGAALRGLAAKLEFLCESGVSSGTPLCSQMVPADVRNAQARAMDELRAIAISSGGLRELLKDADPRVRTLALLLLFERESAYAMADFAAHFTDDAETFREPPFLHATLEEAADRKQWKRQKVSDFARHFAAVYTSGTPWDAEAYIAAHRGRAWSYSSFRVATFQASRGLESPEPTDCDPRSGVRAAIERLPPRDRALLLLMLHDGTGARCVVGRDELLPIARGLGRESLLELAEERLRTSDPDAVPEVPAYQTARAFVLRHATELFRRGDAPRIARFDDPYAQIAAGRLERSAQRLRAAYAKVDDFDDRVKTDLLLALAEVGGADDVRFARDEAAANSSILDILRDHVRAGSDVPGLKRLMAELAATPTAVTREP